LVRLAMPTEKVGIVRGSGEQVLLRPNSIDVAVCISALDHCLNPDLVLSNIANALRDGGCAVIELKNARAWYRPLYDHSPRRLQRLMAPAEHAHPWNFSPELLASRLLAASFRTVDLHDFLYLAPFLRTRRLDWLSGLIGAQRLDKLLSSTDSLGHVLAPGRGGTFVACARK
jgi:SAM-dependent methyltransferase